MTVKTAHLDLYQGDDAAWTAVVRDASGVLLDLAAITPRAQIRRKVADQDPVIVYEIPIEVLSAGTMKLNIPHDVSRTLNGVYVWDLQLTDAAGSITTILAGKVNITLEVTRDAEAAIRARRNGDAVLASGI